LGYGQFTRTANEVNSNNNNIDKSNGIQRATLSHCVMWLQSRDSPALGQLPYSAPSTQPVVPNIPFVWAVWVSHLGCVPSWLLVKIKLILAKPRTHHMFSILREKQTGTWKDIYFLMKSNECSYLRFQQ